MTLVSDVKKRRYKITSKLVAAGGFGEIYRGIDLGRKRNPDVASKSRLTQLSGTGRLTLVVFWKASLTLSDFAIPFL
jgi:hypothetical protein